jgi:hypothetical protein
VRGIFSEHFPPSLSIGRTRFSGYDYDVQDYANPVSLGSPENPVL